jgi:transcription antitermination factor NusG
MRLPSHTDEIHEPCPDLEWYAAYVKHQHERKAADLLERKGVEVFLPQHKVVRRWKDRNKTIALPLFPGYVFVRTALENKVQILSTPGVFFLVESRGRACPIARPEIEAIRRVMHAGVPAQAHPFVTTGDWVTISSGPLAGITGILTNIKNRFRVILSVQLLQKALSIEVEINNVELLKRAKQKSAASAFAAS